MNNPEKAIELIFDSSISFEQRCSGVFQFQAANSPIYKRFIDTFGLNAGDNPSPHEIPLLPIRGFKDGKIMVESDKGEPDLIFKSSGTSDMQRSTHHILFRNLYETAIIKEFTKHFSFADTTVLFYLPGYDRNRDSSLIWMANHLTDSDPSGLSRFISKEDLGTFSSILPEHEKKVLLFGAAFGLMDIIETGRFHPVKELEVLETGGMKTHRREITKTKLREYLSEGFQVPLERIHSEYGMCELLSQMYAVGSEWFGTPHWVKVSIRDPKNPSRICEVGEEGKIGIIDLANLYSCPFILTDDKGVMNENGQFKILGRWNPEDLRGCNFLIDDE